jgi:hypothetical protein
MRVKNPHPKRANARTLLKVVKGRREEEEEEEEEKARGKFFARFFFSFER